MKKILIADGTGQDQQPLLRIILNLSQFFETIKSIYREGAKDAKVLETSRFRIACFPWRPSRLRGSKILVLLHHSEAEPC
jgi:hypothetical protein